MVKTIHVVGDDTIANHIVIEDGDVLSSDKRRVLRNGKVSLTAPDGHVFAEDVGYAGPGWKLVDGKWTQPPDTTPLHPSDLQAQVGQRHRTAVALMPDVNFGTADKPRLVQTPTSAEEMADLAMTCFLALRRPDTKFHWTNTHGTVELAAAEVLHLGEAVAVHVQESYAALATVYEDERQGRLRTHTDVHDHQAWPGDKP